MSRAIGLAIALGTSACGGRDAAQPDAATPPDAGTSTVRYAGTLHSLDPTQPLTAEAQPILAGGEVCVRSAACVTTGADGTWDLLVPARDHHLELTFTASGHGAIDYLTFTDDVDRTGNFLVLIPDAVVSSFYAACDPTAMYPETAATAGILVGGYRFLPPDVYTRLDGAVLATAAGVGPCYMNGPYQLDPLQVATRASGYGYTVFANVPVQPDTADVSVSLAGTTCASLGHVADGPALDVIGVPLHPGFQTFVEVMCE